MAVQDDEMTQDERDFIAAYGEDEGGNGQAQQVQPSGDAGAGAGGSEASEEAGEPASQNTPAEEAAEKAPADTAMPDGGAGAAGAAGPGVDDGEPGADGPSDPKEIQQEKSWRGRLDKRERDLADREAKLKEAEAKLKKDPEAASEAIEAVGEKAEKEGNTELAEAAEDAAESVESGAMSAKDALARLTEDFGSEFVDMMTVVFRDIARQEADLVSDGKVKEGIGALEKRTIDGFRTLGERHMMLHSEKIEEAVPGYEKIVGTPEFDAFKSKYPDGDKIAEGGTARQIIRMLKAFEANGGEADGTQDAGKDQIDRQASAESQPVAQAQPSEAAIDAAAGVRSGGAVRVPESPSESGDYAGAWAQA